MAISLSVVLLLAIILVVLLRGGSIKAGPAIVAILFGFFLASTGMAPVDQPLSELDSGHDQLDQLLTGASVTPGSDQGQVRGIVPPTWP